MDSIVVILLIIILILLWVIKHFIPKAGTCASRKIFKKILLSDAVLKIKEGDLVLFSSNRHSIITRTFGNDTFSHIGIVIQKNNKFYIYEMVEKDYLYPKANPVKNIIFSPLELRITNYNGNIYIASLIKPLLATQVAKLHKFAERDFEFVSRWTMPFKLYTTSKSSNKRFCSELIADLLDVIDISNIPINSRKKDLHTNIVNLCNNEIFYKPIHIIPDNLLVTDLESKHNCIDYC